MDYTGGGPVIDHLIGYAAQQAASRQLSELRQALAAAEDNPGDAATIPTSVTFKADKGLTTGQAVFTARTDDNGIFDLTAYYCTTNDPGTIDRLRSTPGVIEVSTTDN